MPPTSARRFGACAYGARAPAEIAISIAAAQAKEKRMTISVRRVTTCRARRSARRDDALRANLRRHAARREPIADERIVDPRPGHAADARRDNRHPPPVVARAEHLGSPAGDEGEEPRT